MSGRGFESTGMELYPIKDRWSLVVNGSTVYNFKDLGFIITGHQNSGMPPIENITIPFGVLGGQQLQRTVMRPRILTLIGTVEGSDLEEVRRKRQVLGSLVAPRTSTQTPAALALRYQAVDAYGVQTGTILQMDCYYTGGLEGNTQIKWGEQVGLQFVELAPPGIKELTTIQPSLGMASSSTNQLFEKQQPSGAWTSYASLGTISALGYDPNGLLWFGTNNQVKNVNGTNSSPSVLQGAGAGSINALAFGLNGFVYAGGLFNNPSNDLMFFNGSIWAGGPGTPTFNGQIMALTVDNSGNLYIGGTFTTPGNRVAKWNGSAYSALGTGMNNAVYAIAKGPDGNIYFAGDFTTANGVSCNRVCKYDGINFTALGSGMDSTVYALAFLPDGRLVAAGIFVTAGGIVCNGIAIWNGQQWQPLGPGFNNTVSGLAVNKKTGTLYATGLFSALMNNSYAITNKTAQFNGSNWLPFDFVSTSGETNAGAIAVKDSDGALAIGMINTGFTRQFGATTALPYTGTADAKPQIKFTGPGDLLTIQNATTGKSIYFNYALQAGETATLTLDAGNISFISSFYGNVLNKILPGSDLTTFSLVPGVNNLTAYMPGSTGASKIELIYQNIHYSFDAGA
jgi:hypothetical protein